MEYRNEVLDKIIDRLVNSTRSPRGKYAAEVTYPLLERRLFSHPAYRLLVRRAIALVAVAALFCVSSWWLYQYKAGNVMQKISAQAEVKIIRLPDGTSVTLNHYSSLSYAKNFTCDHREVQLDGEAYFEVAKDKRHPFVVKTASIKVEVLGTHFDVDAYQRNLEVRTILYEGSVAITCNEQFTRLTPGEMAVYNKRNKQLCRMPADNAVEDIAWRKGQFIFDDTPIGDVAIELSNYFGTNIMVQNDSLKQYKITARFTHGEDLNMILSVLHDAGYINYSSGDKGILLNSNNE